MASKHVYWLADGAGKDVGDTRATVMKDWIVSQGNAELIIYGGDIYNEGKASEFDKFGAQMRNDVALFCETPGNHDWRTTKTSPVTGTVPAAYEAFWSTRPSRQPIDVTKKGGARYEHAIDINGWRFVFLDTGICEDQPWPMGDANRRDWLRQKLTEIPGRAKIICAHHSRVSCGKHGNNDGVDELWRTLFDNSGTPLAALTMGGHDHNVNIYSPRPKDKPHKNTVPFSQGIHLVVNGAGGRSFDALLKDKPGDFAKLADQYCVTEIELVNANTAKIRTWAFGTTPKSTVAPKSDQVRELIIDV
jgi:hypothetical protein